MLYFVVVLFFILVFASVNSALKPGFSKNFPVFGFLIPAAFNSLRSLGVLASLLGLGPPRSTSINGFSKCKPNTPSASSGATYSIMFATTFFIPNYSFKIYNTDLLIKIKYLTIFIIITPIIVDLILNNQGFQTHITHIGGGCYGLLYIYLLKLKKRNMFKKIISFFYSLSKSKKKEKRNENDYDYNTRKKNEDYKLNQVLDKISKSGYSSLTKKEKKILEKYN